LAVDLANVLPFHPNIDMEAVGRLSDDAPDKLFEQRPDRGGAVRADICNEMESGISNCAISSQICPSGGVLGAIWDTSDFALSRTRRPGHFERRTWFADLPAERWGGPV